MSKSRRTRTFFETPWNSGHSPWRSLDPTGLLHWYYRQFYRQIWCQDLLKVGNNEILSRHNELPCQRHLIWQEVWRPRLHQTRKGVFDETKWKGMKNDKMFFVIVQVLLFSAKSGSVAEIEVFFWNLQWLVTVIFLQYFYFFWELLLLARFFMGKIKSIYIY